jgi:hypothetical protein
LKDPFDQFVMNYRLLFPNQGIQPGYDPNYAPGYPLIVMMHGAGERGNCWDNSCYQSPATYNPLEQPAGTDQRLLNNDHNLVHGGQPHLNAVNLAGAKKPEDPLLNNRAFPGYVLFPQNLNGWVGVNDVRHAIRIVRLLLKRYNIDPNRVYIHGLSNGGYGTTMAVHEAPWLFAAAAPMSGIAVSTALDARPDAYVKISTVPFWFFQGGRDTNPYPSETESLIFKIREEGGITRYKVYPTLGHGVWNNAYNEPDFFTWLLSKNRANIHVDFDNPNICGTNGAGASLRLPLGFPAYQWERDGQIIPGATSSTYIATIAGVYRARFSRTHANPTEQQWNRWSDPVSISEKTPPKPELNQLGTILLTDLNNNNRLVLTAADNTQVNYHWYKDNVLLAQQGSVLICEFGCTKGVYELRTSGFDNCPSPPSDKKYAYFSGGFGNYGSANAAPVNITTPSELAGSLTSSNSAFITWRDNSTNERGFELWRRKSTDGEYTWIMVALTGEDITTYPFMHLVMIGAVQTIIQSITQTTSSFLQLPTMPSQHLYKMLPPHQYSVNLRSLLQGQTVR